MFLLSFTRIRVSFEFYEIRVSFESSVMKGTELRFCGVVRDSCFF